MSPCATVRELELALRSFLEEGDFKGFDRPLTDLPSAALGTYQPH
jgi:hypothetical protein